MKKKMVCFLLAIITIFMGIAFNIYATEETNSSIINVNLINDWFDIIINLLNIVIVVLNFIFVIYVFYSEKGREHKKEQRDYEMHWYNKFIIDKDITLLDLFFEKLEKLINDSCLSVINRNDGERMDVLSFHTEVFREWTLMHNECKSKFCEKIDVVMPEFGQELRLDFIQLQDTVSTKLSEIILLQDNSLIQSKQTELLNKCFDIKKNIIKKLYLKGKLK